MYSLDEVVILPSSTPSPYNHRSELNPYSDSNKLPKGTYLPIFVAPMTCIASSKNMEQYKSHKFIPILPRVDTNKRYNTLAERLELAKTDFVAFSLSEASEIAQMFNLTGYILIDNADGHLQSLFDTVDLIKTNSPELIIMVGNIAHPQMYLECCKHRVDYVRVGIGGGSGCSTSVVTGIHASLPFLLTAIREIRNQLPDEHFQTLVVADGGVNTIGKINKCIALGADFVMCGFVFASCVESCGPVVDVDTDTRLYYGQASKQGQIDFYGSVTKSPEGVERHVQVTKTLSNLEFEIESALRSSMSYTASQNLQEHRMSGYDVQSLHEFQSYNK